MITYQKGDLISLAKQGEFDVVVHGCNCFCRMKRGIAPQMAKAFGCDRFPLEGKEFEGDKAKLGQIEYQRVILSTDKELVAVNAYTQYHWSTSSPFGIPLNYDALRNCFVKINDAFQGKKVGIPKIGAGLAGGDWQKVESILKEVCGDLGELVVVEYVEL